MDDELSKNSDTDDVLGADDALESELDGDNVDLYDEESAEMRSDDDEDSLY